MKHGLWLILTVFNDKNIYHHYHIEILALFHYEFIQNNIMEMINPLY